MYILVRTGMYAQRPHEGFTSRRQVESADLMLIQGLPHGMQATACQAL
jgi:hypothetical protein